ncbi:MAG: IS66 family insertion sequence element accessory protein TnpB [Chromatiaceae bacterium]|jgi:hypothetical protein|nr:IS66 family insertion sequence element accessory protein TnpB [Chromatiaceae bacterium]
MAAVLAGARRSRAQWQSLIERAERSPLSVSAFCAAQGVSTASFYLWRKRLRAEASPQPAATAGAFLDLGVLAAPPGEAGERTGGWELELTLGGGLVLRLRRP